MEVTQAAVILLVHLHLQAVLRKVSQRIYSASNDHEGDSQYHHSSLGCLWLANNIQAYNYLCSFNDVATKCPATCNACSLTNPVTTVIETNKVSPSLIDGGVRWYGSTFQMNAKDDIKVNSFNIHLNSQGAYTAEVYYHTGSLTSTGSWTKMCQKTFLASETSSFGTLTHIPESACTSLRVNAGAMISFYVTLNGDPQMVLRNDNGISGISLINNQDMLVTSGRAVTYMNAASYDGYSFNGAILYSVYQTVAVCQDQSGTVHMDEIAGSRGCIWLANNLNRFHYLCEQTTPSSHCPKTCGLCSS